MMEFARSESFRGVLGEAWGHTMWQATAGLVDDDPVPDPPRIVVVQTRS